MQSNFREIVEALLPFLQALDRFGIPYYVGGSVASSYYGSRRRTQDVDVILAIRPDQIRALAKLLAQDYAIDADAWIDSFSKRQWTVILGVISNQQPNLDLVYLRTWADTLGVRVELE